MSFTRAFEGYRPPPDYEGTAYTKALIQESGDKIDWTTLEELTLDPVDVDPTAPQPRDFSTDDATLSAGWYRVVWEQAGGAQFEGSPVFFPTLPDWAPTVQDVGSFIRARTKASGGTEIGTFTANTRPTDGAVEGLIAQACRRVRSDIGQDPCNADLSADAGGAAALHAAMLIEQSYYPEQTRQQDSSFQSLNTLWKDAIKSLRMAVEEQCGGADGTKSGDQRPRSTFDDRAIIGPSQQRGPSDVPAW